MGRIFFTSYLYFVTCKIICRYRNLRTITFPITIRMYIIFILILHVIAPIKIIKNGQTTLQSKQLNNDSFVCIFDWQLYWSVRKPISVMFKIKFKSYYLVITRKDLKDLKNLIKKLCRKYEKIMSQRGVSEREFLVRRNDLCIKQVPVLNMLHHYLNNYYIGNPMCSLNQFKLINFI